MAPWLGPACSWSWAAIRGGGTAPTHHRLNQAAIAAAMAAPAGERTSKLFQHIVMVGEAKVA